MTTQTITLELSREEVERIVSALNFQQIHDPGKPGMTREEYDEHCRQYGAIGSLANGLRDQLRDQEWHGLFGGQGRV